MNRMLVYGLGCGGLILAGIAQAAPMPKESTASAEKRVVEDYLSPDDAVAVRPGQRFSIQLRSNPTTGYMWLMDRAPDSNLVSVVTNVYEPPAGDRMVGAEGHETWTFKALKTGETELKLRYARPWEKGVDTHVVTNAWLIRICAAEAGNTNALTPP